MSSKSVSLIDACRKFAVPAIGLALARTGAHWVRWEKQRLRDWKDDDPSDSIYALRLFNLDDELRWERVPGSDLGIAAWSRKSQATSTVKAEFMLEGTIAESRGNAWTRLAGGVSDQHWIPWFCNTEKLKGRRLCISAVEQIDRGPQGNAAIHSTVWKEITLAGPVVALVGQQELRHA